MRVLTSPAETGAVTLALPQDTQTEAFDYPDAFFDDARLDHSRASAAMPRRIDARRRRDSREPARR